MSPRTRNAGVSSKSKSEETLRKPLSNNNRIGKKQAKKKLVSPPAPQNLTFNRAGNLSSGDDGSSSISPSTNNDSMDMDFGSALHTFDDISETFHSSQSHSTDGAGNSQSSSLNESLTSQSSQFAEGQKKSEVLLKKIASQASSFHKEMLKGQEGIARTIQTIKDVVIVLDVKFDGLSNRMNALEPKK